MHKPLNHSVGDRTARAILQAAKVIAAADALLITAGAGMSADSGLPVFRGNEGFWRAYPPLAARRISFERMAQPVWFADRPSMAWAFYGHRLQLYRDAEPHAGHAILRKWSARATRGSFVVTSNVDGQFLKEGFAAAAVAEQHGSIHRLQCQQPCAPETWETSAVDLQIDLDALEARGELPRCLHCGQVARPNILMFNDGAWVDAVTRRQMRAFDQWHAAVHGLRVAILEIGAGKAIPTIRRIGERAAERPRTTLVRINPEEREADETAVVVALPALQALTLIDAALESSGTAQGSTFRSRGTGGGTAPSDGSLSTLPSGTMAVIDPPDDLMAARKPATRSSSSSAAKTAPAGIHYVDLRSGFTRVIEPAELTPAELRYCLDHWHGEAQRSFVPLPVVRGLVASGYTMRGQVVASSAPRPAGLSGAALLQIRDARNELVVSVGFARRQREGAYLWRRLLEQATAPLQPLEYPREPWIARRVEPAAARSVAMLGTLAFLEYAIAAAWLLQVDNG
ncbi:MAG TPA: Sir2 family NAD-dependent protein deacetylase [Steroidobacteraceae bacterium]|nr:Sir2 family NAD-dependent protein deacetylase [Steroidobacteraceae bacterium]